MKKTHRASVEFIHDYKTLDYPENRLRHIAGEIYKKERIPQMKAVTVILCSSYKIKKLNASYRNTDRATDVLAFPFDDTDFLGEIYISLQRCKSQASRFRISYSDEIIRVFVHGMFHLLGFTHETKDTRQLMEQHESKYCCL
ncbi:MAG: rRNA maturation RNase YbeY [Chitinivibrionales bacterium]|nr:rRNA maturation RNase YbeY [Chitinivibrionales bacterium]